MSSSNMLLAIVPNKIKRARLRFLRRFMRAARRSMRSYPSSV